MKNETCRHPDPETVAFIAIGATQAWKDAGDKADADLFDGFMHYVNECTRWAVELDGAFEELIEAGDLTCVFAYEIAEPFGYQYGTELITHACYSDEAAAQRIIASLLDEQSAPNEREARDEALLSVRLPEQTQAFLQRVATMSHVSVDATVSVLLAAQVDLMRTGAEAHLSSSPDARPEPLPADAKPRIRCKQPTTKEDI